MRNVIVAGGSRGLGLGIVRRLMAGGYAALAVARHMNEQLAATLEQAEPGSLQFVPFDLAEVDDVPELVKKLHKDFGPIYGLVNNAAAAADGALAIMRTADVERLIRANTLSPIVLTKYVFRHTMADGGGRIVNVSSVIAFTGCTGPSASVATNASLIGT